MRLIRTKPPLELQEFTENELPQYAILSHRWESEEVTFQEMIRGDETIKTKAGYKKIKRFCARAHQDGLEYAWVDTCCINKESSAELSEAINSMFRWYERAEKCYAYLCDAKFETIEHSAWFQRGWTLQELLAPGEVHFLASDWSDLGTRTTLCSLINKITGIDESILLRDKRLQDFSIAKRMSWASARQTTRIEDIAYCLMGIFNVNMPLLYGEGEKAFIRLQEEIMKDSDDQTLFAWENEDISEEHPSGLLARSPADFRNCSDIVPYSFSKNGTPFALTNRGIRMHLPLVRVGQDTAMLILECCGPGLVGIRILSKQDKLRSEGQWIRVGKTFRRDIPFRILSEAVLDILYVLKAFMGDFAKPHIQEVQDDGEERNTHGFSRAPFNYKVQPRGHHKKLIVCFDRTGNELRGDNSDTNISKIYRMLYREERHQLCYYKKGHLDTCPEVFIMNGYKFVMNHYEPNDEIYLFGSANGAYAALVLASLIEYVGVLNAGDEDRVPQVWEIFRNWTNSKGGSMWRVRAFRESFCRPTGGVAFIGLFDAVYNQSFRKTQSPLIMSIPDHIIRHAVSVDERYVVLRPILVQKLSSNTDENPRDAQDIQEIWFPGTHHDMIGSLGNSEDDWPLSHVPLIWMVSEGMKAGLQFDRRQTQNFYCSESSENDPFRGLEGDTTDALEFKRRLSGASREPLRDPLSFGCGWSKRTVLKQRAKECLLSSIYNSSDRVSATSGSPRKVPAGAAVHLSVLLRVKADLNYRPSNLSTTSKQLEAEAFNWTVSEIEDNLVGGFYIRDSLQGLQVPSKIENARERDGNTSSTNSNQAKASSSRSLSYTSIRSSRLSDLYRI
ncbi:hypothetical protein BDV30DRAFT_236803 [Aspergillus minisclerotigenes]|uniref:Heterokaryon incompatibility protein-domain-containing protein n=1 Tax=Aspergillus minisclerotigenes TaxID=656917 RepID=A0A5N6J9D5_9EURO|nr:hypothetical protein BDV30DRAFT_236803 [Aspergillus minisclerotigenes]